MKEMRKKLWIDRFQTRLFFRIVGYFVWYQVAVWSLVLLGNILWSGAGWLLGPWPATFCLAFLTCVVLLTGFLFAYDAVKYAHRVVGPLVRLRHSIKAVAAGEEVDLVVFRKDDLLGELKDEFNDMLRALERRGAVVLRHTGAGREQEQPLSV